MVKKQLLRNSLTGIIQLVFSAILTFISVPIFINKLGLVLYGVFTVLSVIGNLNFLTNFGLNGSLLVYLAQQGKCKESDHDIIVTQVFIILIVSVFSFLTIFFKEFIVINLFGIPQQFIPEGQKLLIYLVLSNALLIIGQTNSAILDAIQKIYITNICQFIYSLVYWVGMIIIVSRGGSLSNLGLNALAAAIIWLILISVSSYRYWGKLKFTGVLAEFKRIMIKQLSYGFKIYLSGLAGFLFEPLSKILLSNFIGLQSVAFFEIGAKVKGQINSLVTKALYPLYPYIANSPINSVLKRNLFDFSKKIQLITIPISVLVIFEMPILLKLWLGNQDSTVIDVFVIIMTVTLLLFSPSVYIIYQYLAAKNMADRNIWVQVLSAFVNISVFFSTYKLIGLYAILLSNSFAFLSSFLLCSYYQMKYFDANYLVEYIYFVKIYSYGITCSVLCLFISFILPNEFCVLIVFPLFVASTFVLFLRWFRILNSKDLDLYFGTIPSVNVWLARLFIK
jgi:O-antigen/teichoic acid export membrane protein